MKHLLRLATAAVVSIGVAGAVSVEADGRRGAGLFRKHRCVACHTVEGEGASTAPELGKRMGRYYSPAGLASQLWNHAPVMWTAMKDRGIDVPQLTERDAADLFAFFYAARYFELLGDAGRGKAVFSGKKCDACHALAGPGNAKSVAEWGSARDPLDFAQKMWNHAHQMESANLWANRAWPQVTPQQLADLTVWLQNRPEARGYKTSFVLPSGLKGKELLDSRGCNGCHAKPGMQLEQRLAGRTLTDVAAAMWNHAPKMEGKLVGLSADEMRQILAYAWASQFVRPAGDRGRGAKVFSAECAACHEQGTAPKLSARAGGYSTLSMVSALFQHGPKMLAATEKAGKPWPKLKADDMANLVAFLDSPARP